MSYYHNDDYEHETTCSNCGCVYDERYADECPECNESDYEPDPDYNYDSRV